MLINYIEIFAGIETKIRQVNNPKIWLEMAISKACRAKNDDSYDELLVKIDELEKKLKEAKVTYVEKADTPAPKNKKSKKWNTSHIRMKRRL